MPYPVGVEVPLPVEPQSEVLIEQLRDGTVARTWWHTEEGWVDTNPAELDEEEVSNVLADASSWAWIVQDSIGQGMTLRIATRGPVES